MYDWLKWYLESFGIWIVNGSIIWLVFLSFWLESKNVSRVNPCLKVLLYYRKEHRYVKYDVMVEPWGILTKACHKHHTWELFQILSTAADLRNVSVPCYRILYPLLCRWGVRRCCSSSHPSAPCSSFNPYCAPVPLTFTNLPLKIQH